MYTKIIMSKMHINSNAYFEGIFADDDRDDDKFHMYIMDNRFITITIIECEAIVQHLKLN